MRSHPLLFHLLFLCLFMAAGCNRTTRISSVATSSIEFSTKHPALDSSAYYLVAPYKEKMDLLMNEVLGISDTAMTKDLPQGTLGNFVSDAVLKRTNAVYTAEGAKADICLLNNGGLRAQLPKGNITRGKIFELMPFENSIVVLQLSGERTWQMFSSIVASNGAPFAGAELKARGKKLVSLKIGGQAFDSTKTYRVATSDYLAGGGDKYDFFREPLSADTLNYKIRDAIIDHIREETKQGRTLSARKDERILYE